MSNPLNFRPGLPAADAEGLCALPPELKERMRGLRLLIAGGTGFMGRWLLASLVYLNRREGLNMRAAVLSRRPEDWLRLNPSFRQPEIDFAAGDLRAMPLEGWGRVDAVVHMAADALPDGDDGEALSIARYGTERLLEVARRTGARRVLYVSSGAVYGTLVRPAREEDARHPSGSYAQAKALAETLCLDWGSHQPSCRVVIARCFAFAGPWLPLDRFAVGNFLRDRAAGRPVHIRGDGTDVRSYLYPTDMIAWLWAMLLRGGPGGIYNLGSGEGHSLADVARLIAGGEVPVCIEGRSPEGHSPRHFYLPDVSLARRELGLAVTVPLGEALERSLAFLLACR